jgi:hypothetical protein
MNEASRSVRIIGFRVENVPLDPRQPNLGTKEVEFVDLTTVGNAKYMVVPWRVKDVMRDTNGVWEVVEPHYNAWKQGEAVPTSGTPLSAWQGITRHQIEAVRLLGIYTVEDMAAVTDATLQKLPGQNLRSVRDAAVAWEKAKDTRAVTADLAAKELEIQELRAQVGDLMDLVRNMPTVAKDDEETVKRRPGRPRKEDAEAA